MTASYLLFSTAARETAIVTQRTLGQSGASISPEKFQEADASEALRTRRVWVTCWKSGTIHGVT